MKPHTSFWWLGWLALLTSSTYGQGSDSASHDLRIFIVEAEPSGSGMGGMGLAEPTIRRILPTQANSSCASLIIPGET